VAELADLMREIADGGSSATDRELTVVTPPDERSVGVLAFAGHNVVSADVPGDWVRNWLPDQDLSAPLQPPFLTVLAAATGRILDNLDMVLVARATGRDTGMDLTELYEFLEPLHPRLARALAQRIGVRAWRCPGGLLTLGRGVGGRWEVSIEVEPALRGFGLGHMSPERVVQAFPDLADGADECPPGCDHLGPECALDAWVEAEGSDPGASALAARLDSLRRLLRSREGIETD